MSPRKTGKPQKRKRKSAPREKRKIFFPLIIAAVLFVTIGAAFIILVMKPQLAPRKTKVSSSDSITFEEPVLPHTEETVEHLEKSLPTGNEIIPVEDEKPVLAIVIDDMGFQLDTGMKLLELELEMSFAFLPSGPHLERLSRKAVRREREILLHFPMEPASESWDPGPGAVYISMDESEMRKYFEKNITALPSVGGINNHMGSRFTQNHKAMRIFLGMVKERDLYFLDSMTSRNSVGEYLAREMGVATARRHVFLDNDRDVKKIEKQIRHLLVVAERKGHAIGIGHPYKETYLALKGMRKEIMRRANMVGVSRMVH